ncbi:MaoC family dehydratase [Arthrobacter agilis]|uniref:MaoC family dehydratase n=1 Tax=Arthrobacter agilis TaxID=37921 RepID=UPI00277FAD44|nr:MaoC/PaaZ C-terminal domain-containing protein [Arthrobacter agilis]MDQ0734650.1 acyl dehydratase [Arthrobacter agilis]
MSGALAEDVTLPGTPRLAGLYRQALMLAARRTVRRGGLPSAVPPARHRVDGIVADLGALTRYQQLFGSAVRDLLPSAYLHTLAFPVAMSVLARADFPLPLLGMVHLSNEVRQERPVGAFEAMDVVAWAEDLRPHPAGTQVDLVTEVSVAGERVWAGRSVYLARGIGAVPAPRRDEVRPSFAAPAPTGLWRLGADTGRRYAAVSGDWNPIHLSGPSARALGMKTTIAHGMYLAARMVDEAVPAPAGALAWRIDFAAPVLLPGTVTTSFARTERTGGSTGASARGGAGGGIAVEVVGWSAERRRQHFTGWVRAE